MTAAQALAAAAGRGLDRLDGQLLLLLAMGRSPRERAWLLAHDTDELDERARLAFMSFCERRAAGEPLAYISGRREFFGLDLGVDARVLVPRPDTETLVEWALDLIRAHGSPAVIDLGTGSGAIALAIKSRRPDARVAAVDSSAGALQVAAANAHALKMEIDLRQGSWLAGVQGRFDLIVSNPPYIAAGDEHLPGLAHEPVGALVAGPDGLDDLRTIIDQAPAHLASGGWLLLEHGYDQAGPVQDLLSRAGFGNIAGRQDLSGIDRCCGGQWLEQG
jgi:release factor glutamine methyltransferase